ncbi:unnamed protein product [Polarella glacialis]|uniref:Uncharacterized protein n=1 Tax=Polarella glacialis TaxID=89957 RepID=A0A813JC24_POLGL|nr:unnamed protein product [Polarella glacialis]CAE8673371.1 unnamed protein product [Polarella glacialis]
MASLIAGVATLSGYQLFLSSLGGADFILHAPRVDLFSANREGALSCAGFLSLHWLSVALGSLLRPGVRPAAQTTALLLLAALVSAAATALMESMGLRVSRRMCNLPYVTFAISVNAWVLALLAFLDLWAGRPRARMSLTLGGIQDSMLAAFLAANIFTGAVNVSLQPLLVPFWPALAIMALYCLCWSVPFAVLNSCGRDLKFW